MAAAMELFRKKGLDGVNMRELAEKAGVNKGLLHYYFKSKDAIFREVFIRHAGLMWGDILGVIGRPGNLDGKLEEIVGLFFNTMERMPSLPAFVLFEVQRNPALLVKTDVPGIMLQGAAALTEELHRMGLPPGRADGIQFLLDAVALCAFTFGMLPGVSKVLKLNKAQQTAFLAMRKAHVIAVLKNNIRP